MDLLQILIKGVKPLLKRIAICYDFDKTLAPDDMQAFTFIPSLGMGANEFWTESNGMAEKNGMDKNLAWMHLMLTKAKAKNMSIKRKAFQDLGKDVKLYAGVDKWFDRINTYAQKKGIIVEHYIISSGLKEIIEGSPIAEHFKKIYASTFYYDVDGIATWPAQAINYTNKTQYIFRIAKGAFDENDTKVNDSFPDSRLYVPYENMIYIGDSDTDIPCMKLVKSKGGISIGVFDPQKNNRKRVYELFNDKRINFFAPADYRTNKPLFSILKKIIDNVASREALKEISKDQQGKAEDYQMYKMAELTFSNVNPKDKALANVLKTFRDKVEGNID